MTTRPGSAGGARGRQADPAPVALNGAQLIDLAEQLGVDPIALEKDLVLTLIIREYATGPLGEQLVLKGGQALRHIYGSARLSKDADYVARRRIEFADLRAAFRVRFPKITFPGTPEGLTRHGFKVRPIQYRGPLERNDRVEMEVSFREDLVLEPDRATYRSPFCPPFDILVMRANEMVAEKVRAMYQRGQPRDLYDLWFLFTHPQVQIDDSVVAELIPYKFKPGLVAGGFDRSRLYDRIRGNEHTWDDTLRDLVPEYPSFDDALVTVERRLRPLRDAPRGQAARR